MSDGGGKFTVLSDELHDYLVANGARADAALAAVRESTAALGSVAEMQISPDQGALLTMLARLIGATRAIELGTFTGYSAICIARGLTDGGTLLACELDPERAETAKANFAEAGVADRIEIRVGPAQETLDGLVAAEGADPSGFDTAPFDLAFIDADKSGYPGYYESCLELVRAGGLIVIDNVLRGGAVLDPASTEAGRSDGDEGTRAVAGLNELIAGDERVDVAMLGVADGITLARKR